MIIRVPFFGGDHLRFKSLKSNGSTVQQGDEIYSIYFQELGGCGEAEATIKAQTNGVLNWAMQDDGALEFDQIIGTIE